MNATCPRGVYQLLLAPCLAMSFTGPINANSDYDFLKIHPAAVTIFQHENLPNLALTNAHSLKYVKMYTAYGKVHTAAMLGRGMYYFPIYERHLSAQQMPLELKYLSMVESELRTDVESPSGAVGLWQFMSPTARHYGLRQNDWRDERRDPEAATLAAVRYLKDLYIEFGNWELALGAYNCGSGRMRGAIRRAKSTDFTLVRKHLPVQTQSYLAKFYAAAYISNFFEDYQISPKIPMALSGGTSTIEVKEVNSFAQLSRICHLPISKIKRLNPQYTQGVWPNGAEGIWMVLPEEPARRYLAHFNRMPQRIDILPEDAFANQDSEFLPVTEPYRILNSRLMDLGGRQPAKEQGQEARRYYSKYFLRGEA
ncbi:lytic transglycosylase domain-containing protein [Haliscomenobacter sp.]|uniref:lytic transglycosylase domain-containing protein n=1 Tax=Haliscomenobacter sp. TaxID=2717303 RepID=UPI003593E0CB